MGLNKIGKKKICIMLLKEIIARVSILYQSQAVFNEFFVLRAPYFI